MDHLKKVLIIEDSALIRTQVKMILEKHHFAVQELGSAEDLFASAWQYGDIDLMLLDIRLPGMDGLTALGVMDGNRHLTGKPIIILSSIADKNTVRRALQAGAKDYIVKPLVEDDLLSRVNKTLKSLTPQDELQFRTDLLTAMKGVFDTVRDTKGVPIGQISAIAGECLKLVNSPGQLCSFNRMTDVAGYTASHSLDVAIIAGRLGKWLGFKAHRLHDLILAGLLHDIGKTQIPQGLLDKPGEVTPGEMAVLRSHSQRGRDLLSACGFAEPVLLGIGQHHERLDGSGYPDSLSGQDICLAARIIAIADVYDAMTSNKCYRSEQTPFAAIEELFSEMFGKLDPHFCTVFLENIKNQLIGQIVRLADGCEAKVIYIDSQRVEKSVLETTDGRLIGLTKELIS